jgi:ATP-dependent DNA helicase RecQ
MTLGRQLIRLGYLNASHDIYQTLSLSPTGRDALTQRNPILLTRAPHQVSAGSSSAKVSRAGNIACDEGLFAELRGVRKTLADARGVPPYVVFGDVSLRHMARRYPVTEAAFLAIPGVGSQKLADFGPALLQAIGNWLTGHEPQPFPQDEAAPKNAPKMKSEGAINASVLETLRLFRSGKTPQEIATLRAISPSTIAQHFASAIVSGGLQAKSSDFYSSEDEQLIDQAATAHGYDRIGPLHEALGGRIPYDTLHFYRAFRQRAHATAPPRGEEQPPPEDLMG